MESHPSAEKKSKATQNIQQPMDGISPYLNLAKKQGYLLYLLGSTACTVPVVSPVLLSG